MVVLLYGFPGLELTFYSGVYGTCLGAMSQFGENAKGLIGLSGILIGVGEILGKSGSVFTLYINVTNVIIIINCSLFDQEGEYLGSWINVTALVETQWCFSG